MTPIPQDGEGSASETARSPSEIKAALDEAEAELQAVYRKVWPLREAYAAAVPPAALPSRRRDRTETQEKIARCPRCGTRLQSEGPTQK